MAHSDRAIVFDLYGVLARHQDPVVQDAIEAVLGVTDERSSLWEAYWVRRPAYDRGDVGATEWWTDVAADVGRTVPPGVAERLVELDVESWSRFDASMLELVGRLRDEGRELGLLSNAPVEIAAFLRARQPWLSAFTAVVFSCEAGAVKPEPAAYAAVETALGRTPDELLLVDDRAENVAGAQERGWAGLVFTGRPALLGAL